ncbi:MAG: TIGR04076 family protein [Spirochaetes bacterium]|nr:TIGR04076 family protein [Spirochaetota bacterium]
MGKSFKITVIHKAFFEDLAKEYLSKEEKAGDCPVFEIGNSFIIDGEDPKQPENFCTYAWQDIFYVCHSISGGATYTPWWKKDHMQVVCCTDGTRPVSFLVELISE